MKKFHGHAGRVVHRSVVLREIHGIAAVEHLLTLSRRRTAARNVAGVRRLDLSRSRVIVAFFDEVAVGLVAYRRASGPVRVVHELAVDFNAPVTVAAIVQPLLTGVEAAVRADGGSRVEVVLPRAAPLRPFLEGVGYRLTLVGRESQWLEKGLLDDESPLSSA